ncbi:hypothetical protein [Bergeyella zoohelcum]|uniref:Oxidase n=1 Tax=Bergeyella zoohelcum TaxID=1015 RepID=A0A380ZWM4_9FLAO|nr:hypothetical protein [Bergeyella zoohelcum]EKB58400.1 hypothetical protein HMPREF9700_01852 [Bergeyella zoohelcum CCUG 30536]SUV53139.1 Uncharacterised protein [Bergeyella zoohelcum]
MKDSTLNQNYDVQIENGDFIVSDSQNQSIELLLSSAQGEWKESPLTGANLHKAKHGKIDRDLYRHIGVQLKADGFNATKLQITTNGIDLQGSYEK